MNSFPNSGLTVGAKMSYAASLLSPFQQRIFYGNCVYVTEVFVWPIWRYCTLCLATIHDQLQGTVYTGTSNFLSIELFEDHFVRMHGRVIMRYPLLYSLNHNV